MSLMCDSILKPVCVLAVNIRFDLFFPLIVSGMSLYRNAWVFMTGRSSTRTGAAAAPLDSCLPDCAAAVAAAASAGSNKLKSLREYFMNVSSFPSVSQYTPLASRSLALDVSWHEPLGVFDVKIAKRPPQSFARHRSAI